MIRQVLVGTLYFQPIVDSLPLTGGYVSVEKDASIDQRTSTTILNLNARTDTDNLNSKINFISHRNFKSLIPNQNSNVSLRRKRSSALEKIKHRNSTHRHKREISNSNSKLKNASKNKSPKNPPCQDSKPYQFCLKALLSNSCSSNSGCERTCNLCQVSPSASHESASPLPSRQNCYDSINPNFDVNLPIKSSSLFQTTNPENSFCQAVKNYATSPDDNFSILEDYLILFGLEFFSFLDDEHELTCDGKLGEMACRETCQKC